MSIEIKDLQYILEFFGTSLFSSCFVNLAISFPLAIFAIPFFNSIYLDAFLFTFSIVTLFNYSLQRIVKRKIKEVELKYSSNKEKGIHKIKSFH